MLTRPIRDVIRNKRVISVSPGTTVRAAAKVMKENWVGAIMVVDGGKLAGIFTERDALFRVLAADLDPDTTTVAQVMTSKPLTMGPDQPFAQALHAMYEGGFRHLPIVEDGRPVGMISARDAMGLEVVNFERERARKEEITEILG